MVNLSQVSNQKTWPFRALHVVEVQDDGQVDVGRLSAVGKNYSIES